MSRYIDGFVIPIATEKVEEYRKVATLASRVWKDHGALEYIEAVGDDLAAHGSECHGTSGIPGANPWETLVFAYITYASREHRDEVNAKVMADPRMKEICPAQNPDIVPPFDPKRMLHGGFRVILQ